MADEEKAPSSPDRLSYGRTPLRREAESLAEAFPPLLVEAEHVASTVAQGMHGRRRVGMGETFWQFRRYAAEDPITAIDWRQSAKGDHLFVRESEWEAAETVWLWRDTSASMHFHSTSVPHTKAHRAGVLSLALASLLVRAGEFVGAIGGKNPPGTGRTALRRLAHEYTTDEAHSASVVPAQPIGRFGRLVIFSDFLVPLADLEAAIAPYVNRGVQGHLLQILDPAEEAFPYRGRKIIAGVEEEIEFLFGKAEAIRGDYLKRLAAHRAGLADIAGRVGWTFTTHHTNGPAQAALLSLYAALGGTGPGGPVSGRTAT